MSIPDAHKGHPEAHCLYCGKMTGWSFEEGRKTVCGHCIYEPYRDEQREVDAGMRPWARPLHFFSCGTPMAPDKAAEAKAKWDAEQDRIKRSNEAAREDWL